MQFRKCSDIARLLLILIVLLMGSDSAAVDLDPGDQLDALRVLKASYVQNIVTLGTVSGVARQESFSTYHMGESPTLSEAQSSASFPIERNVVANIEFLADPVRDRCRWELVRAQDDFLSVPRQESFVLNDGYLAHEKGYLDAESFCHTFLNQSPLPLDGSPIDRSDFIGGEPGPVIERRDRGDGERRKRADVFDPFFWFSAYGDVSETIRRFDGAVKVLGSEPPEEWQKMFWVTALEGEDETHAGYEVHGKATLSSGEVYEEVYCFSSEFGLNMTLSCFR